MRRRLGNSRLGVLIGAVAALGVFAPSAGAVLIHVRPGQVAGIAPRANVAVSSIPGSFARRAGASAFAGGGNLDYHGGPVLHATAPFLIFWDPGHEISASSKALYGRYLADAAAVSGAATNVFSVDRQYTDATGFAGSAQSFAPSQAITDTQAYPTTGNCSETWYPETTCLYDSQLQAEISRLIGANSLPTGITGYAPIYFVVTPPNVNSCLADNGTCADNVFCAYHSSYTDAGSTVLYADIPTVFAANDPKGCQADGNAVVQNPNGDPITDVALTYMSHEFNETITDPVNSSGWYDSATGQEDGDNCNFFGGFDPAAGSNPNAFTPYLGGSASAGTLFNQAINGDRYYTQSEWSNGEGTCKLQPTAMALSAALAGPSSAAPGTTVSFDPSASTSSGGYTSTTWNFGDGTQSFSASAPTPTSHTYSAYGTYTVTVTVVDSYGNLSTASDALAIHGPLTAAFTASSPVVAVGAPVSFDGSTSSQPGGSISSYSWDFGDGTSSTGAGTSHAYAVPGIYTARLTVNDASGGSASASQVIHVSSVASAGIAKTRRKAIAGVRFSFSGSPSQDAGAPLAGYRWSFGDGGHASGISPAHTFAKVGTYHVTLTVTDATGAISAAAVSVPVTAPSIVKVRVGLGRTLERVRVTVSGPGVLKLGSRKIRVGRPRTITIKVRLSRSQRDRLHSRHKLTITLKPRFVPTSGKTSRKTARIELRG